MSHITKFYNLIIVHTIKWVFLLYEKCAIFNSKLSALNTITYHKTPNFKFTFSNPLITNCPFYLLNNCREGEKYLKVQAIFILIEFHESELFSLTL